MKTFDDVNNVKRFGCGGIGLFRTEFLYMGAGPLPSEEKQYSIYRRTAEEMGDKPVIIRTLDIGGDKYNNNIVIKREANPFMGLRAIRLCLHGYPDIFRTQLRGNHPGSGQRKNQNHAADDYLYGRSKADKGTHRAYLSGITA